MELLSNGEARFYRPDGRPLPAAPRLAAGAEPVCALASRLARKGVAVDARATLPGWEGGPVDYGWSVEWLRSLDRSV